MGALVLTRPMFDRLRQNYPSAAVYVLCSDQNIAALDLIDVVDAEHVITVRIGSLGALATDSRPRRPAHARAPARRGAGPRAVRPRQRHPGGPERRDDQGRFSSVHAGGSLPRRRDEPAGALQPHQHIAQQFVTLADAIGSTDMPTAKRLLRRRRLRLPPLLLRPGELESARDALYRRHPSIAGRPLVFVCPGAGLLPIRAWPIASFASVSRATRRSRLRRGDRRHGRRPRAGADHSAACHGEQCVDLTGYTETVRDVTVLLHLGVLLITNDGGTGHMAVAHADCVDRALRT